MINKKHQQDSNQLKAPLIETEHAICSGDVPNTIITTAQVQSGASKILLRLPLLVLLRPRRSGDAFAGRKTHAVNIHACSEKEAQILACFTGRKSTNTPLLSSTLTDENDVTFHIRGRTMQENQGREQRSWLCLWSTLPRPAVNIVLSDDDDDSLIKACHFDGYVYLVYANDNIVELRRFDPVPQIAERYLIAGETRDSSQPRERLGPILSPAAAGMALRYGIKILQAARSELNQLPIETMDEARERMDAMQTRVKRHFSQEYEPGCLQSCFSNWLGFL